jgi:hypothetical protein
MTSLLKELARSLRRGSTSRIVEAAEPEKEKGEDSLDAQIDKYLSEYEAEAKNAKNEGLNFRMMTRRFLVEADEEEDEKEDDKDEEKGDEEKEDAEPEKLSSDDIDVGSFVTDVMRLVDNYDNLLEIRNTILRRASNYLAKNYDKSAVETFKEELLESYGVEIGVSQSEKEDETEFQAPKAAAAGPAGGGGA